MKITRLLAILVVVALFVQPVSAMAAGPFDDYAEELKRLGLFKGTDNGFELERAPSRAEAVVMLIRLLGKESEALSSSPPSDSPGHPFTDVPAWADAYISFAYRNGLTKGISPDRFGSNDTVTAPQYFTFILRALGYSDSEGDFEWSKSAEKAYSSGIVTREDYLQTEGSFLRGNLVDISYNALGAKVKGGETTLLEKLVADGAVAAPSARLEGTKLIVPVELTETGGYQLYFSAIAAVVPDACHLKFGRFSSEYGRGQTVQQRYLVIRRSGFRDPPQKDGFARMEFPGPSPGFDLVYFLLDQDLNLLAYSSVAESLTVDGEKTELAFETEIGFDCPTLISSILEQARDFSSRAYEFDRELFVPHTYPWLEFIPGQSEPVPREARTTIVDRAGLPEYARGFTRYSYIGYYWLAQEWLAAGFVQVDSIDDIDVPETLREERIGYLGALDRTAYALKYDNGRGITFPRSWTSDFALLIVLLQDDAGVIRAYTYFTVADLARIAHD